MENRELENNIASVVWDMVPEDTFGKISERIADGNVLERNNLNIQKRSKVKKVLFPVAAACIFLIVSVVFGLTYYGNNYAIAAVIDIDVNPSIQLSINKKEKVLKVKALNDDAEEIIEGIDFEGKAIENAVDDIVGSMVDKGYVTDDENSGILVTVQNNDPKKAEKFRKKIVADFDKALGDREINAPVINQSASDVEKVKEFAEKHDVSVGKAMFIEKLLEEDETLTAEELAEMSIKEIMDLLEEKNIEIEEIAHCHRGDHGDKKDEAPADKAHKKDSEKTPEVNENDLITPPADEEEKNESVETQESPLKPLRPDKEMPHTSEQKNENADDLKDDKDEAGKVPVDKDNGRTEPRPEKQENIAPTEESIDSIPEMTPENDSSGKNKSKKDNKPGQIPFDADAEMSVEKENPCAAL